MENEHAEARVKIPGDNKLMVALRATFRLGWELPNPINRVNENAATRYPFAILTP